MDVEAKGFIKGIALVVAIIVRNHDQPTMAYEILIGTGYKINDLEEAGVDNLDLAEIKTLIETESKTY